MNERRKLEIPNEPANVHKWVNATVKLAAALDQLKTFSVVDVSGDSC